MKRRKNERKSKPVDAFLRGETKRFFISQPKPGKPGFFLFLP
jgi:hypothetical protein